MTKLRPLILRLWQDSATSSDEPDNERLAHWVGLVVQSEEMYRRELKDTHRKLHDLRQEMKARESLGPDSALGAAVGHLSMALGVLGSARRRITGDYIKPERRLSPLGPLDDAIARVKDAKKLLTGEPVEPCPGGCGVDLGHPGNPDRQCACPKPEPRVWELLAEITEDLPRQVTVDGHGHWYRPASGRDYMGHVEGQCRTLRLEQLRYLGTVREVRQ